jgi:hypothetical protein
MGHGRFMAGLGFRKAHGVAVPFLTTPAQAFRIDDASTRSAAAFVNHDEFPSLYPKLI